MTNIFAKHESDLAVVADLARPDILKFGDNGIAYNGNIELGNIDRFLDARTRKRGTFSTDDLTSFSEFVEVHGTAANTEIFIDKTAMKAMAVLNFGDDNYPMGHCDFCAVLTAKSTTVFEKLTAMHKQGRINQKAFAEFLEDWAFVFKAINSDGEEIAVSSAIGAVRQMRLDASVVSDSSVGNFKESRSRLASIEAKSTHGALPAFFEVTDPCFNELTESVIKLRLTIGTNGDDPTFSLSIIGLEALIDNKSVELADLIGKELGDTVELYMGQFGG